MIATFIYKAEDRDGEIVLLTGPEAHHITKVMRLARGEMVRLIDGQGIAHICEITSTGGGSVECRIIKTVKNGGEAGLLVTLAIGLSTASRFDAVIEKGTEAGIGTFVPLLTEKGKVKIGDKKSVSSKMKRWERIAEAAVKQSGRSRIPAIAEPVLFADFVKNCDPADTVLFHPGERADDITGILDLKSISRLTVIIGPESGFSPGEIETARDRGIAGISLGPRILRTETAGILIPGLIIYLSEIVKA